MTKEFLIISAIFALGYMGFIRALWGMMGEDGMFDKISGGKWSVWLNDRYGKEDANGRMGTDYLHKVLGGCEQCTSFWWVLPYIEFYYFGTKEFIGWGLSNIGTYLWLTLYWLICSMLGLLILTRNKAQ